MTASDERSTSAPVTVIIPVYRALDEVRRCVESVLRHAASSVAFDLLVIDDGSPEPELRAYLDSIPSEKPGVSVSILRNEENLGFVKTCNRGLRQASGDVVLLNSDTVVTDGWLDRLAAAARLPDVATVTPLTNFGSLCTLSDPVIDAFELGGTRPLIDDCAAFIRNHSLGQRPEIISGVGFCMYMTRDAIDLCGLFDEATFGAGYGEEVDFCMRASSVGFRHLAEDSTFVFHQGAASFNERRQELMSVSRELIHQRYPYFRTVNLRERAEDPLRIPFAALELGLQERDSARPHVLQMLHSRPGELGGTEKHFWQLIEALLDDLDCSVLQPVESGFLLSTVWRATDGSRINRQFLIPGGNPRDTNLDDPAATTALRTVLDMFDFDAVHIQNIFHHSLAPLAVLADFDGPVVCSVRDQYLACPHHWLLYRNVSSCGIPEDLSYCATCLPETRHLDLDYLQTFRRTVASRLGTVDHWVFATQSAVDHLQRVYDIAPERIELIEHGAIIEHERTGRTVDEARILDEPLRVAFVGIGWAKKGLPVVNRLAECFATTSIEIHHFGELREPISPEVHEHGSYDNSVLPELLWRSGIQVVLLPGPVVESFGHVMTESLIAGLPLIASRSGALGERIRRHEVGWTIDPEDFEGVRTLIENLDGCRLELLRATRRAVDAELRPVAASAGRYATLYRSDRDGASDDPAARGTGTMNDKERLQRELRAMATVNRQLHVQLLDANQKLREMRLGGTAGTPGNAARRPSPKTPPSRPQRARAALARHGALGTARVGLSRVLGRVRRGP